MSTWYKWWKRTPGHVRKPFILVFGFTIVGTGIVLLPLPGPGWLTIFAGFAVLASEFAFAERVRDKLIGVLKLLIATCKKLWARFKRGFDLWMQT